MKWAWITAGALCGAGIVVSIALALSGNNPWLTWSGPISAYVLTVAFFAALAVVVVIWLVRRRKMALAHVSEAVRAEERDARRRFLRRLDHEVKNPVTAMRTALATVDSNAPGIQVATAQATRLSALVQDLSKLADLETRPLECIAVDMEQVARDAIDAVQATRPDREYGIAFPSVPWPVPHVRGDEDLLLVAMFNLVANAAKYSDAGARIEVRGSESDGFVAVEVSDSGWGIPAEEVDGVWDELARGSSARGVDGTGLGLSIVRVIAERHGGSATLRSAPGTGTRVAVRLPVHTG